MPKLEPKVIQKELEQGLLWPVYWLYGQERMKSRELLKRIRSAVFTQHSVQPGQEHTSQSSTLISLAETLLDGSEVHAQEVVDNALSQSLLGALNEGPRLVVIRDAHLMKNAEVLGELLLPRAKRSELSSVCVFLSKDLDGRKKFSKQLLEKAAVVPCEEVPEADREAWIQYLAKRKGVQSSATELSRLANLEPWSLDIVDQELEKCFLLYSEGVPSSIIQKDTDTHPLKDNARIRAEEWMDAFFKRDLKTSLNHVQDFAEQVDESLPLLGLLAWNARYLAIARSEGGNGLRGLKVNSFVAERLQRWGQFWQLPEILELQKEIARLDFCLKQTPLVPLGVWSAMVMKFCKKS